MKLLYIAALLIFFTEAHAQYVTTYYFNKYFEPVNENASYRYKATVETEGKKLRGPLKVQVELNTGITIQKYAYASLESGIRCDTTLIYRENGKLFSATAYSATGKPESEFLYFENGDLLSEQLFIDGKRNGDFNIYYDNGVLNFNARYIYDHIVDTTSLYYKTGIIYIREIYAQGKKTSQLKYNADGILEFEYVFNDQGDTTKVTDYRDATLEAIVEPSDRIREKTPEYPGGLTALYQYIADGVGYPKSARKNSITGKVMLKFLVDTAGNVDQIQTIKPVFPLLDFEAMRVVSRMGKWQPGIQNNKEVEVWYTLPIVFKLE